MSNFIKTLALVPILLLPCISKAQIHLGPNQSYPNIQAAASANAIQPGDTVYLHTGSYAGYQAVTNLKGSAANWIVITRYQNDPIDISGTWQFISCEYLRFQNLTFRGNATYPGRLLSIDNGGSCSTQSEYIIVDGCSFSNTTDPSATVAFKFAGVDHFEVTNNQFLDIPACEAMDYNTCYDGLIRGNRLENCLSGGHIKGGASNITMERNLFINASKSPWVAFELGGDTGAPFYCPGDDFEVKNLSFHSNILLGGYRGLALSSAKECQVINNTFYDCGQATMRFLTISTLYPTLSGNLVENNLFAFGSSAYFNGGPQLAGAVSFSHNLYYSLLSDPFNGPYWDSPALDAIRDPNPVNIGFNTPMFVDGPGNDFRLITGSPAIGVGKPQPAPLLDFFGNPFHPTTRAVGAIEIEGMSNTDALGEMEGPLRIYPNPASHTIAVASGDYGGVLEIWSPTGFKLLESQSGQNVWIGQLSPGVYFLKAGNQIIPFLKQ